MDNTQGFDPCNGSSILSRGAKYLIVKIYSSINGDVAQLV